MIIQIQRLICCKQRLKAFDLKFSTFYFNLCVQTWSQGIQVVPMRKSHFTWKMISRHWAINRTTFVAGKDSHKGKCNCLKCRLKTEFRGLVVSDMTFLNRFTGGPNASLPGIVKSWLAYTKSHPRKAFLKFMGVFWDFMIVVWFMMYVVNFLIICRVQALKRKKNITF